MDHKMFLHIVDVHMISFVEYIDLTSFSLHQFVQNLLIIHLIPVLIYHHYLMDVLIDHMIPTKLTDIAIVQMYTQHIMITIAM